MNRRDFVILGLCSTFISSAKAGAWESGSFDNDDALDWANECARSTGATFVSSTLNAALKNGYIEVPESSAAIAAAEVVAAARGRGSETLPKDLKSWLANQSKDAISKLAPTASKAVSRILNGPQSELQELWKESKDFPTWQRNMNNLLARLKG
jgi:hypothetical protein